MSSPGAFLYQSATFCVRYYGAFLLLGMVAILANGLLICRHFNLSKESVLMMTSATCISGALGARLYYVSLCLPFFLNHPDRILRTDGGGLSIHGCMIGLALTLLAFSRLRLKTFLSYLDFFTVSLPLGQAIWRLGIS